jgi:Helix-turn-helix domain
MSQNEWAASPEKLTALKQLQAEFKGNSAATQRARILKALQHYSLTSFELMRYLDIYHPPARILELRRSGCEILTSWKLELTESGKAHRVGLYVLSKGKQ